MISIIVGVRNNKNALSKFLYNAKRLSSKGVSFIFIISPDIDDELVNKVMDFKKLTQKNTTVCFSSNDITIHHNIFEYIKLVKTKYFYALTSNDVISQYFFSSFIKALHKLKDPHIIEFKLKYKNPRKILHTMQLEHDVYVGVGEKELIAHIHPGFTSKICKTDLIRNLPRAYGGDNFEYYWVFELMLHVTKVVKINQSLITISNDRYKYMTFMNIIDQWELIIQLLKKHRIFTRYRDEIEYQAVKTLIYYLPKNLSLSHPTIRTAHHNLEKAITFLNDQFPDWRENKYLWQTNSRININIRKFKNTYLYLYKLYWKD